MELHVSVWAVCVCAVWCTKFQKNEKNTIYQNCNQTRDTDFSFSALANGGRQLPNSRTQFTEQMKLINCMHRPCEFFKSLLRFREWEQVFSELLLLLLRVRACEWKIRKTDRFLGRLFRFSSFQILRFFSLDVRLSINAKTHDGNNKIERMKWNTSTTIHSECALCEFGGRSDG